MELNAFVEKFVDLFDETEPNEIDAKTVFRDLDEWSSLIALSVIAMAKTEFGKTLTNKEMRSCETVEQLFNLIVSK